MKKHLLALLLSGLLALPLVAQVKVQVVTQSQEKDWSGIRKVIIHGKKADISVRGWSKTDVGVHIRRISKHPDRTTAESELAYLITDFRTDDGVLTLTNSFRIPQTRRSLQSQLKAVFELWLPVNTVLQIDNSFGDISLTGLNGEAAVLYEFGKLSLSEIRGKLTVRSDYGDLDATDIGGQFVCRAEKADLILRQLNGTARIESRYGRLSVRPGERLSSLTINAARTEISVYTRRMDDFQYDIKTTSGSLNVPDSHQAFVKKLRFDYQPAGNRPGIRIAGSYSPVTVVQSPGEMLIKH